MNARSAALAAALVATVLVASSCGHHDSASESRSSSTQAYEREPVAPASSVASSPSSGAEAQAAAFGSGSFDTTGSLPPDLVVTVPDTAVTPGEAVEFSVQATSDVSEVVLWDGLNDRQALAPSTNGTWRVTYRVPLKPARERFGVSLTARTPEQRWRRVWVFLTVTKDAPVEPAEASLKDS